MAPSGRLFNPDSFGPTPEPTDATPGPSGVHPDGPDEPPSGPVVRVTPDVSGFDKEFDYVVPDAMLDRVGPGALVRIELKGRNVAGWVTSIDVDPDPGLHLLPISRVSSIGPSADLVELARWAARRWGGRLATVLKTASPPRMVRSLPEAAPSPVAAPPGEPGVTVARVTPNEDLAPMLAEIAGGGNTLVVVPRVGMAAALAGRLRRQGLTVRFHPRDWAAAAARGGVVIGARSAVWARVPDLAAIVVIDEHDEALQEERNPTWHARDVAIERARRAGIACHLVSPAPSLAAAALAGDAVRTPARTDERAGWPPVEIVDRRDGEPGRSGLFSARAVDLVRGRGSVLAVLNRKGRAVMLACAMCGELARTEDGERLMVERDGVLIAPSTGEERPLVCAVCGATKLKRLRLGVSRAAEELSALAGEPVGELTGGSSPDETHRVVVGTEAALHQLGRADAVVFLDFDQELLAPRYRAAEQAMALLVLAARLVGPRALGGRIVVQTRSPEHRVLRAAVRADPGLLVEAEATLRRGMGWPPFGALAEVSGAAAAEFVTPLMTAAGVSVLGPRDDGRYLLRTEDADRLATILATSERPSANLRVAVDPPRA